MCCCSGICTAHTAATFRTASKALTTTANSGLMTAVRAHNDFRVCGHVPCCRLAVAGVIASSAAYVTAKLAEAVGHASYVTALAIAKSLPGHKKRQQQGASVLG